MTENGIGIWKVNFWSVLTFMPTSSRQGVSGRLFLLKHRVRSIALLRIFFPGCFGSAVGIEWRALCA
jgi:hypothetical protein